jgi:hypothetical protein
MAPRTLLLAYHTWPARTAPAAAVSIIWLTYADMYLHHPRVALLDGEEGGREALTARTGLHGVARLARDGGPGIG